MAFSSRYREFVEEKLSACVPLTTRAMFGGLGIYSEGLFFALVDEDKLYFKVSHLNQSDFEAAGMEPFIPWPGAKPMGYWEVPPHVIENPSELKIWIEKALAVAESKKGGKGGGK